MKTLFNLSKNSNQIFLGNTYFMKHKILFLTVYLLFTHSCFSADQVTQALKNAINHEIVAGLIQMYQDNFDCLNQSRTKKVNMSNCLKSIDTYAFYQALPTNLDKKQYESLFLASEKMSLHTYVEQFNLETFREILKKSLLKININTKLVPLESIDPEIFNRCTEEIFQDLPKKINDLSTTSDTKLQELSKQLKNAENEEATSRTLATTFLHWYNNKVF